MPEGVLVNDWELAEKIYDLHYKHIAYLLGIVPFSQRSESYQQEWLGYAKAIREFIAPD
jgi:hypothetical protein